MRLSLEDSKTDSLSISSQRLMLREHAMSLPEWEHAEILEFVDNGHSGANFERPAVQDLLEQVRNNKIDCIIVKDFSRFGRNSLETGYFIERVFPLFHTRFISVSDNFDTINFKGDTGGIDVAFKYLISECYSRDMSVKTKTAKYVKMRRGEYQSKICPYGYKKGADGRLEIDEEAAVVVRKIFGMAAGGMKAMQIARALYANGIPTPGEYKTGKGEKMYDISRSRGVWHTSTILRILRDERYIGTYVIGKRAVTEIGGRSTKRKDESEWIKIPDHHAAIIPKDVFEKANSTICGFSIPNRKKYEYPLRGKVFCGCCGHALSRTGDKHTYYCRYSQAQDLIECYGLKIREDELEVLVLDIISKQLQAAVGIDDMSEISALDTKPSQQSECEKQLAILQDTKRGLYEKYLIGTLDLKSYMAAKAECDAEIVQTKNTLSAVSAQLAAAKAGREMLKNQREIHQEVSSATGLTRPVVDALIDKVMIFPDDRIEISYISHDFMQ
ncbi:MAG: recombinase family protein [Christensenellaceae bacterium]